MAGTMSSIPKEVINKVFIIGIVLFLNILLLHVCSALGCYEVTFSNIFRINLFCNACIDMSYHLQKYQHQFYFLIGGYLLKKMTDMVDQTTK